MHSRITPFVKTYALGQINLLICICPKGQMLHVEKHGDYNQFPAVITTERNKKNGVCGKCEK